VTEDTFCSNGVLWAVAADTQKVYRDPVSGGCYSYWTAGDPLVVTLGILRARVDEDWDEELDTLRLIAEGTAIERGEPIGSAVDGEGDAHELPSPVTGTVCAVNQTVLDDPETIVTSWLDGWLVKVRVDDGRALYGLDPLEEFSYEKPFDTVQAEKDYLAKLMARHSGEEFVQLALSARLGCAFLAARLLRLGLLDA
jgi:glycine cleavage system H lipoate-binding protein